MTAVLPLPAAFDLVETLGSIRLGLDDPSFELSRAEFAAQHHDSGRARDAAWHSA